MSGLPPLQNNSNLLQRNSNITAIEFQQSQLHSGGAVGSAVYNRTLMPTPLAHPSSQQPRFLSTAVIQPAAIAPSTPRLPPRCR